MLTTSLNVRVWLQQENGRHWVTRNVENLFCINQIKLKQDKANIATFLTSDKWIYHVAVPEKCWYREDKFLSAHCCISGEPIIYRRASISHNLSKIWNVFTYNGTCSKRYCLHKAMYRPGRFYNVGYPFNIYWKHTLAVCTALLSTFTRTILMLSSTCCSFSTCIK